jgi:hypothetical protein
MEARHLIRRFFGSVRRRTPAAAEEAWLRGLLSPAEDELYLAQSAVDRVHSIDCALAARASLGVKASRAVIVASALHDVGKTDAGLGTMGRVGATLVAMVVPAGRVEGWRDRSGWRGRIGRYATHDRHGCALLQRAGSHPIVVAWAREHHLDRSEWTIEADVAEALLRADR